MIRNQQGFTLVEALVTIALVAVAAGGLLGAISAYARFATHPASPVRMAATVLAEQTLRAAQNTWKYGSPGAAPSGSFETAVPVVSPGSAQASAPVQVTATISNASATSATLEVTVRYTPDPGRSGDPGSVTLSGDVTVRAPIPGSTVEPAALFPQPDTTP